MEERVATNYESAPRCSSSTTASQLNVAAFYTDIKDLQAGVDAGNCSSRLT